MLNVNEQLKIKYTLKYISNIEDNFFIVVFYEDINSNIYSIKVDFKIKFHENRMGISYFNNRTIDHSIISNLYEIVDKNSDLYIWLKNIANCKKIYKVFKSKIELVADGYTATIKGEI